MNENMEICKLSHRSHLFVSHFNANALVSHNEVNLSRIIVLMGVVDAWIILSALIRALPP